MKHPGIWLAVIDGRNARFIAHDTQGFHTFRSRTSDTAGLVAGRPLRTMPGRNVAKVPSAHYDRRFAAHVAAELNNAAARR